MGIGLRGALVLPLLLAGPVMGHGEVPLSMHVAEAEPTDAPRALAIVPYQEEPRVNLQVVRWTTPQREELKRLADRWGMRVSGLRRLNPDLKGKKVDAGRSIVVYRGDPDAMSRSVGFPNRGRLEHGVPFPEGQAWMLRPWRPRTYGTGAVVARVMAVFSDFARRHPEAAPVVIGEISNRRGGRARPHSSHQSGRDVDLGYISVGPPPPHGRWPRITPERFDAKMNWAFVRALLATGEVERIFIDRRLQKRLLEQARRELPLHELGQWFSIAAVGRRAASKARIGHWAGHDDHMHVRFRCTPADLRCDQSPKRRRRHERRRRRSKRKAG